MLHLLLAPVDGVLIGVIVAVVLIVVLVVLTLFTRYKICPPDKIMVVQGALIGKNSDGTPRGAKCTHGGAQFVWPFFQK